MQSIERRLLSGLVWAPVLVTRTSSLARDSAVVHKKLSPGKASSPAPCSGSHRR